jgi:phage head maturation protease
MSDPENPPKDDEEPQLPAEPEQEESEPVAAPTVEPLPETPLPDPPDVVQEAEALLRSVTVESAVSVRNLAKREIDVRLAPFGTIIETIGGPETIERGAFRGADPDAILLMGLEHEVHLGIGQDGTVIPTRRPMGKAMSIEERDDAGYGTFRVAKTAAGDEMLALAEAGIIRGVSIEMGRNVRTRIEKVNGRRVSHVEWADLRAVSPTYSPAYAEARVLAVRSQKEDAPVATEDKAPEAGAPEQEEPVQEHRTPAVITRSERSEQDTEMAAMMARAFQKPLDNLLDRMEKMEERSRSNFEVPGPKAKGPDVTKGDWTSIVIRNLVGERVPETQMRVFQEVITADNLGVVPEAFLSELIGVIDPSRPFLATTRRMPLPTAGMTINVPVITQRPTTAVQAEEKDDISSTKTIITSTGFDAVTIAGGADISVQVLRRSSPSYLDLFLELLAEAYAIDAEDVAIDALIAAVAAGGPEPASALNPNSLNLGAAFQTSFNATRRPPDTIWLSTEAVAEFIDAKATTTNQPLYPGLSASATAAGGISGPISGLRAVHVPTLDAKGAYAIVGPSSGFAWTEDGTFTLQVDVPSKAGRDVALVGILWAMPLYPAAFSLYNVAS